MTDMLAALHWVQKNIAAFGGDPRKVTIDGESAGAIAVAAMVGSPEAKGLFIRAAAQSGAWMGLSIAKQKTMAEAEAQGKTAAGTHSMAELRAMSTADVSQNLRGVSAGMIVDGWIIPEDQSIIFEKGKQNAVDILVGSNRDEGTFFGGGNVTAEQAKTRADRTFGNLAPTSSSFGRRPPMPKPLRPAWRAAATRLAGICGPGRSCKPRRAARRTYITSRTCLRTAELAARPIRRRLATCMEIPAAPYGRMTTRSCRT